MEEMLKDYTDDCEVIFPGGPPITGKAGQIVCMYVYVYQHSYIRM